MSDSFLSGAEFDFPAYSGKPKKTYLICSTGRSGSTLLCSLLGSTGLMGMPHEYFHVAQHSQQLLKRLLPTVTGKITSDSYFDAVVKHRTSPNGVFGIKAHLDQCLPSFKNGFIPRYFGKIHYVVIRRSDLVAQAVSLVIASQTGKWTSHENAAKDPQYSYKSIGQALSSTIYKNFLWTHFFAVNGINACEVIYEQILENPTAEVQRIADFMGIDAQLSVNLDNAGLSKEATELNTEWIDRFNTEMKILS